MQREPVDSEALRSIGYDQDAHILEIEFVSGSVYRYFDLPDSLYCALIAAGSHGGFFASHIRDAGFDCEQVDRPLA